ncbi:MAG: DTW domain-containing protein [Pigmentiphaga sp.]|nr:DTW domain-containing protein [Pigmentiphaga sp.]
MPNPPKPPRARCERCLRPLSHCLCAHIPALPNRTRVLILQHPDEAKHPLNTARLARQGLRRAELWIGEHFPGLHDAITSVEQALLLFPARPESPRAPRTAHSRRGAWLLIVPDGTWRKARKIVQANPVLTTLPHLSLPPGEPSEYRVRQTSEPGAVSTIEAIARALTMLEPQQDFQPLLKPFRVLVEQQIHAMGNEVYRSHYLR